MPLLPQFYGKITSSGIAYGNENTGDLDITRLLASVPAWKKPAPEVSRICKKLVITDCTAPRWLPEKINGVMALISELQKIGFEVYRFDNPDAHLELISDPECFYFSDSPLQYIRPFDTDALMKMAISKLSSPADNIFFMDEYWIDRALGNIPEGAPRSVSLYHYMQLQNDEDRAIYLANLQKEPNPVAIILDDYQTNQEGALPALEVLREKFSNAEVKVQPYAILLDETVTREAMNGVLVVDYLPTLSQAQLDLALSSPQMKSFTPDLHSEWPALATDQLIQLNISEIDPDILPNLQRFVLHCNFSLEYDEQFLFLMTAAPNLIDCYCKSDYQGKYDFNAALKNGSFNALRKLSCSVTYELFLPVIMRAFPRLVSLDLTDRNDYLDRGCDCNIRLGCICGKERQCRESVVDVEAAKYIKELRTDAKSFRYCNGLYALLALTENITKLDMEFPGIQSIAQMSMSRLTSLKINLEGGAANLSYDTLWTFINRCPALETLHIDAMPLVSGVPANQEPIGPHLQRLKHLIISKLDFSEDNQRTLALLAPLKLAPAMQKISFFNCELDCYRLGSLANVEKIILIQCKVFPEFFKTIAEAPKLERLNLSGSVNPLYLLWKEEGNHPIHLLDVVVEVSESEFSPEQRYKLESMITGATFSVCAAACEVAVRDADDEYDDEYYVEPHNSLRMLGYRPQSSPFTFRNINSTKSQKMIIDKLSQYLILCRPDYLRQHPDTISLIQNGVCGALSRFFCVVADVTRFNNFLEHTARWDGAQAPSIGLQRYFAALFTHVEAIYLSKNVQEYRYVEESMFKAALEGVFNTPQTEMSIASNKLIIGNPWHTISLRQKDASVWVVYDPNYNHGPKEFNVTSEEEQKALFKAVRDALGALLLIDKVLPSYEYFLSLPFIADTDDFIKNGGLLALMDVDKKSDIISAFTTPQGSIIEIDSSSLNGILLRDTDQGYPAWYFGINDPDRQVQLIAWQLLAQFILKNPYDFIVKLKSSLELLELDTIESTMLLVKQSLSEVNPAVRALYNKMESASKFETALIFSVPKKQSLPPSSPNKQTISDEMDEEVDDEIDDEMDVSVDNEPSISLDDFCATCVNPAVKKRLVALNSGKSTLGLQYAIQQYCVSQGIPYFVAQSQDDLICSGSFIKANGNNGIITKGPGGPLHEFLTGQAPKPAVLLINFDQIDVVQCNSILDAENPNADGTAIPDSLIIIGLMDTSRPDCYLGADFVDRWGLECTCPIPSEVLEAAIPPLPIVFSDAQPSPDAIYLFNRDNYRSVLAGDWILNGDTFTYNPGALAPLVQRNSNVIEINGGLWDDPRFVDFWHQAIINQCIPSPFGPILIPKDLQLICSNTYDWRLLSRQVIFSPQLPPVDAITYVINPSNLNTYLNHYVVDNHSRMPLHCQGLIGRFAGQDLPVILTRAISEDNWAMLLRECAHWNVRLVARCAPGVALPEALSLHMAPAMEVDNIEPAKIDHSLKTQVVTSTDVDTTLELFYQHGDDWLVIDVSDCEPSDLLKRVNGSLDQETLKFDFVETESVLLVALEAGRRVILKGWFSDELVDCLAPLLLERARAINPAGQLVLISEDKKTERFAFYRISHHAVSVAEKKEFLLQWHPSLDGFIEFESLSKLRARHRSIIINNGDSAKAWQGLYDLPSKKLEPEVEVFDANAIEIFIAKRTAQLEQVLAMSPFVYIAGLSGVGKSSFIELDFARDQQRDTLYQGEANLLAWAMDNTPGKRKIFFWDEINFNKKLGKFEGLFNRPQPGILIDGTYYPLTADHKVIFAGNPASYGSGRTTAKFFERHGNCVVFDPIPAAVIALKIIRPVLSADQWREEDIQYACERILAVYAYLCERSTSEILVSPRELQMMALQAIVLVHQAGVALSTAINEIAWRIGSSCLPSKRDVDFDRLFKPKVMLRYPLPSSVDSCFITASREPLWQQLHEHLSLRELRYNVQLSENDAQRYGGLGGILVEGEPGAGKSQLVEAALKSRGYQRLHFNSADAMPPGNYYYVMPASMPIKEKKQLLLEAFDKGAVVICNEANSGTTFLLEDLLNALLMGKTPDGKKTPKYPGFAIFCTQNPHIMGGNRLKSSTAIARRLQKVVLAKYPTDEMAVILTQTFGEEHRQLIETVLYAQEKAAGSKNPPTFRRLLNIIRAEIDRISVKQESHFASAGAVNIAFFDLPIAPGRRAANDFEDEPESKRVKL